MSAPEGVPGTWELSCPLPLEQYPHVLMAHGGGGKLMHQLLEQVFHVAFANPLLDQRHDGALLELPGQRLAFTTDSYVVRPLFFPGGDIGTLAVNGTVNDLAMCGAKPLWLSAGFILEEGFPIETLWRLAQSMRQAADRAGVQIVTGDTKVVDRGKADGVFINTAGIGSLAPGVTLLPSRVQPGDAVLLSGDIGRHGIAIMAVREGLQFETAIESDCAPLAAAVHLLLASGVEVHCLRDPTRGGLASALLEIAQTAGCGIEIDETLVPVRDEVRSACEILGLDPLYVANEGRFVAFVAALDAEKALDTLRQLEPTAGACIIGSINDDPQRLVTMRGPLGTVRVVDMLSGEQLPRIC